MTTSTGDELIELGERLSNIAARADDTAIGEPIAGLIEAAEQIGKAWSGSNIGYHADVYYNGFQPPPPGAHFSSEWGFFGTFQGTTGEWREYPHDDVIDHIQELAGRPDQSRLDRDADAAEEIVVDARDDAASLLHAHLGIGGGGDDHLRSILGDIEELSVLSYDTCLRAQLPAGGFMTRDSTAMSQGLRSAPHQEVLARAVALRAPFGTAGKLASLCRKAARHLSRIGGPNAPSPGRFRSAGRIVIGHGRSPAWHELKDFVGGRLGLEWDEFNRVAVAGVATADRLREMLETSTMALLVATAEDETPDGVAARQNVVHEIGLFQGHLGFGRAIVLLEEGCAEFSNIHGLGQIRFQKGNIAACFDDVRRVIEREGLL